LRFLSLPFDLLSFPWYIGGPFWWYLYNSDTFGNIPSKSPIWTSKLTFLVWKLKNQKVKFDSFRIYLIYRLQMSIIISIQSLHTWKGSILPVMNQMTLKQTDLSHWKENLLGPISLARYAWNCSLYLLPQWPIRDVLQSQFEISLEGRALMKAVEEFRPINSGAVSKVVKTKKNDWSHHEAWLMVKRMNLRLAIKEYSFVDFHHFNWYFQRQNRSHRRYNKYHTLLIHTIINWCCY
jgi:hypothetical protein